MKTTLENIRGNAMPLILVMVLVIGGGLAGWLFLKDSTKPEDVPAVAELPVLENGGVPEQVPTVEQGVVAPAEEETAPVVDAGPVKIDVAKAMGVRAMGNIAAPIKIVEYASLTCSHCAHFHNDILPELKTKYIDTGKVYIEFREFPLNDPAMKATLTARCLPEEQYEGFVSLLFKTQDQWAGGLDYMTPLRQNAKLAGMSDATFDACQAEPQLKLKLAESMQQGKDKWKISATPTFIINDGAETISGVQPVAEFERIFRKLTNDAVGAAPAVQ